MKFLTSFLLVLSACSIIASKSYSQQWELERDTDLISDTQNILAGLDASNDYNGYIVIRCLQQVLEVLIGWGPPDSFDSEIAYYGIEVTTRLDQQEPVTDLWIPSSDLAATFGPRPEAFIRELASHDRLVARATTTFLGISTLTFDLTQAGPVVEEVLEACGYE